MNELRIHTLSRLHLKNIVPSFTMIEEAQKITIVSSNIMFENILIKMNIFGYRLRRRKQL